ncbi:MAG: nuclear transport factor 2 family protein [Candidatus Sulfotelmatobacter sp.]
MRTVLSLLLLLLVVPRFNAQEAAGSPQADESRILTLELAWNQAVQEKDAKALEILIAPEMVYIEYDGTLMNRAEYLASVAARSVHAEQILSEAMMVHLYGAVAVVSGVYRETGAKAGKPYLHRERFTDTWVRRGGSWLCVASQSTLITK